MRTASTRYGTRARSVGFGSWAIAAATITGTTRWHATPEASVPLTDHAGGERTPAVHSDGTRLPTTGRRIGVPSRVDAKT
jgi:hypothetical protein